MSSSPHSLRGDSVNPVALLSCVIQSRRPPGSPPSRSGELRWPGRAVYRACNHVLDRPSHKATEKERQNPSHLGFMTRSPADSNNDLIAARQAVADEHIWGLPASSMPMPLFHCSELQSRRGIAPTIQQERQLILDAKFRRHGWLAALGLACEHVAMVSSPSQPAVERGALALLLLGHHERSARPFVRDPSSPRAFLSTAAGWLANTPETGSDHR
jgi:hypothetical protein